MDNIDIRLANEQDYRETEILTREAFWDLYRPGCCEHLLLHKIRTVPAFIEELDFVAYDTRDNKIVGNIVYSKAKIINKQNKEFTVLCLGPVGVLPSYQGKGIGTLLIGQSLDKARSLGYKAVVLFGNLHCFRKIKYFLSKSFVVFKLL